MQLTSESVTLNLRTAFRIAHGVSNQRFNVFAHLDEGGQQLANWAKARWCPITAIRSRA